MIGNNSNWMSEVSKVQELFGQEISYPHSLIQSHIKNELDRQNQVIRNSSIEVQQRILDSTSDICGTLNNGFEIMIESNTQLNESITELTDTNKKGYSDIISELSAIDSTLNWGFSKLIELQKQSNLLLNDMLQILHIDKDDIKRKKYIERGIEFFQKSTKGNYAFEQSKLYFEKALEIENVDFYVLYNLGLIHYFSSDHLDFKKAITYFNEASKFAYLDIDFKPFKFGKYSSSFNTPIDARSITTSSYLYAGRCSYELKEYKNALEYSKKAFELNPESVEVAFDKSKFLAINNNISESVKLLSKTIEKDRYITIKIINDIDLIKHSEINTLLKGFKDSAFREGQSIFNNCIKSINSNSSIEVLKEIKKVEYLLNNNNYLNSMHALDILKS